MELMHLLKSPRDLSYWSDDFNRADGPLDLTIYDYYTGGSYLNIQPRILSNACKAPDPGTGTVLGKTAPKVLFPGYNHRVEFTPIEAANAVAQSGLICRMSNDGAKTMNLNIVDASHAGISNFDGVVPTNRTSYDRTLCEVGDRYGFEVYGNEYVAYRLRAGKRLNLTAYTDTGYTLVPQASQRFGFYAISANSSGTKYYGPAFDNFEAWDLPDRASGDFIESGLQKNGSTQSWPTSATWVDLSGVVAHSGCPGSVIASNGVTVRGSKAAANFYAKVPFTGGSFTRTHTIRIVRVSDGAVIATGDGVTSNASSCFCEATAAVVDGEVYKIQMNSNGSSAGTVPASTALLQIT
ncbi:hypothetical protein [Nocardia niwae]|uniref:hypothetical protein n=1 Tax=Nocardia niwae TaxID=626084 RepID=UPI0007A447AE|nr:hypothetical protein [Nocardia niwae]